MVLIKHCICTLVTICIIFSCVYGQDTGPSQPHSVGDRPNDGHRHRGRWADWYDRNCAHGHFYHGHHHDNGRWSQRDRADDGGWSQRDRADDHRWSEPDSRWSEPDSGWYDGGSYHHMDEGSRRGPHWDNDRVMWHESDSGYWQRDDMPPPGSYEHGDERQYWGDMRRDRHSRRMGHTHGNRGPPDRMSGEYGQHTGWKQWKHNGGSNGGQGQGGPGGSSTGGHGGSTPGGPPRRYEKVHYGLHYAGEVISEQPSAAVIFTIIIKMAARMKEGKPPGNGTCSCMLNPHRDECRPTHNCTAEYRCDSEYRPVCASNHQTYPSKCAMLRSACHSGRPGSLHVVREGECTDDCNQACPDIYEPVCGSDGQTYSNECYLEIEACRSGHPAGSLYIRHEGVCHDDCNQGCTAEYSPVCGSDGQTYPNVCHLRIADCQAGDNYYIYVAHQGECRTDCPDCGKDVFQPVCGSDNRSYSSECEMNMTACKAGKPDSPRVIFHHACGHHDGDCTVWEFQKHVERCIPIISENVNGATDDVFSNPDVCRKVLTSSSIDCIKPIMDSCHNNAAIMEIQNLMNQALEVVSYMCDHLIDLSDVATCLPTKLDCLENAGLSEAVRLFHSFPYFDFTTGFCGGWRLAHQCLFAEPDTCFPDEAFRSNISAIVIGCPDQPPASIIVKPECSLQSLEGAYNMCTTAFTEILPQFVAFNITEDTCVSSINTMIDCFLTEVEPCETLPYMRLMRAQVQNILQYECAHLLDFVKMFGCLADTASSPSSLPTIVQCMIDKAYSYTVSTTNFLSLSCIGMGFFLDCIEHGETHECVTNEHLDLWKELHGFCLNDVATLVHKVPLIGLDGYCDGCGGNGECIDSVCFCKPGFAGPFCHQRIDSECISMESASSYPFVSSPDWPRVHPDNTDVCYTFPPNTTLEFCEFALEEGYYGVDSCTYDYLTVNGVPMCGEKTGEILKLTDSLTVAFHSDGAREYAGFLLKYCQEGDIDCNNIGCDGCISHADCNNGTCTDGRCFCDGGYGGNHCECLAMDTNGQIFSPGWPANYAANSDVCYVFSPKTTLEFCHFDVNCFDYLYVNGVALCDSITGVTHQLTDSVKVTFHSYDDEFVSSGYHIKYCSDTNTTCLAQTCDDLTNDTP